jgi:hypothetical protein
VETTVTREWTLIPANTRQYPPGVRALQQPPHRTNEIVRDERLRDEVRSVALEHPGRQRPGSSNAFSPSVAPITS